MARHLSISAMVLLAALTGCPAEEPRPTTATLSVQVTSLDGAALAAVALTFAGDALGETGPDGLLEVVVTAVDEEHVLLARADGFVRSSRFLRAPAGTIVPVSMVVAPEAAPIAVEDVEAGFTVTGARGASLEAPPGAFVDEAGAPATGAVEVFLTPFDPAIEAELLAYPGDLRGSTTAGSVVMLDTWGVVDAVVRQGGRELSVAPDSSVTVSFPTPSWSATPPEAVQIWSLDDATGLWREEPGEATYDEASDTFVASFTHLTPLNCDRAVIPACLRGRVRNEDGRAPSPAAWVQARTLLPSTGEPGGIVAATFTDMEGSFCLYGERNQVIQIEVRTLLSPSCPAEMRDGDYCVTTRTVNSGSHAVMGNYPAGCDADCLSIWPTIRVGRPDRGPQTEIECDVGTGFDGPLPCGNALTTFYECFSPAGACTYDLNPMGAFGPEYDLEYENGASMSMEFDPLRGPVQRYLGPGGEHCGDLQVTGEGSVFILPGGDRVETRIDEFGRVTIDCGDGFETALGADEADFIEGCTAAVGGEGGVVECTPRPGSFGAECLGDGGCDGGLDCCGPLAAQQCAYPSMCDALCASDVDCLGGPVQFYCCNAGYYQLCLPEPACYLN